MAEAGAVPSEVTVVVPTCNRRDFVADVITALKVQTLASFDALIVDDGSTDDTSAVARAAIDDDPRFRLVPTPNRGPASARNVACAQATTEWLAFTDDDCIPQPGWLEALLATAVNQGAEVVQGRTISDPAVKRKEIGWFARGKSVKEWSVRFQTCNLLVKASRLRAIGGFDESFPPRGFGEDTDAGLRMVKGGATTAFASEAVVHHRVLVMTYLGFLQRRYRWAQVVHMVAVNPDTRVVFPHRYVAQRMHVAFWVSLPLSAWGVATGRWWVPLAAVAAYVGYRVMESKGEGRSLTVRMARAPLELVGVALESVGFVVESIRHRCLLL
jgi:glycosyltransferase involved in cell wall biosynthesis